MTDFKRILMKSRDWLSAYVTFLFVQMAVSAVSSCFYLRKGKAVPLQAWSGPEGSRKLRFPDFVTTAQDGGRLSALRTGRLYPPGNTPATHLC